MNKRTRLVVGLVFLISLSLTGCSYFNDKLPNNPPTQRQQHCIELKRNLTFTSSDQATDSSNQTIRQAELMKMYQKDNCEELENK